MAAQSSRVFAASRPRMIAVGALSLAGLAFGVLMYAVVPTGAAGTAFLLIPMGAAAANGVSLWRTQLTWADGVIRYQRVFGGWSVHATDIENWKLRSGVSKTTALELRTRQGQTHEVPAISSLSINDTKAFSRDFAAMIAAAKARVHRAA